MDIKISMMMAALELNEALEKKMSQLKKWFVRSNAGQVDGTNR